MGAATAFVLLCSNIVISLLRNVISDKVRIPCYIVMIASFTVLVEMAMQAYAHSLYQALGIYLPLIAVNCVIFARAEMFANKNSVFNSILDAVGMGVGFTLTLLVIASIREILGNGSWFGIELFWLRDNNISIMAMAPGGFIVFACLIALVNKVSKGRAIKKKEFGCTGCPAAAACGKLDV
jgi:electron transport complex protein RnfE